MSASICTFHFSFYGCSKRFCVFIIFGIISKLEELSIICILTTTFGFSKPATNGFFRMRRFLVISFKTFLSFSGIYSQQISVYNHCTSFLPLFWKHQNMWHENFSMINGRMLSNFNMYRPKIDTNLTTNRYIIRVTIFMSVSEIFERTVWLWVFTEKCLIAHD